MPTASLPLAKRQKTDHKSGKSTLNTIAELEKQITEALAANESLNSLTDLLHVACTTDDAETSLKAIFALYRVFTQILSKGLFNAGGNEDVEKRVVRAWVSARLNSFTDLLCGLLKDEEKTLRNSSLKILFSILRQLSTYIVEANQASSSSSTTPLQFDVVFFRRITHALLLCPTSSRTKEYIHSTTDGQLELDIQELFVENWFNVYADIRWFFLRETTALLDKYQLDSHLTANALSILERLTNMPTDMSTIQQFWIEGLSTKPRSIKITKSNAESEIEDEQPIEEGAEDDWRTFFDEPKPDDKKSSSAQKPRRVHTMSVHEQLHSVAAHRAVFTKCWLTLLPMLPPTTFKGGQESENQENLVLVSRALGVLHRGVLPHLTRAVLIMDWVASSVDFGGNVGLLALNALFILIQEYNLDYPLFYTRLYAFLDRNVLHLKYRARFFRLTEVFLSSSHLPATLLASFVKRLSRLSLTAPPAAIIMIIPFTYNILKRHPKLMVMIHCTGIGQGEDEQYTDPYDASEKNPTLTSALESSLWELYSQKRHYHSTISTMAKIFEDAFTKPNYAMEDFLDHTYATLLETEINRKIKKDPPVVEAEMVKPMVVRTRKDHLSDEISEHHFNVVSSLWALV